MCTYISRVFVYILTNISSFSIAFLDIVVVGVIIVVVAVVFIVIIIIFLFCVDEILQMTPPTPLQLQLQHV